MQRSELSPYAALEEVEELIQRYSLQMIEGAIKIHKKYYKK